jgi:hypothetical protein
LALGSIHEVMCSGPDVPFTSLTTNGRDTDVAMLGLGFSF